MLKKYLARVGLGSLAAGGVTAAIGLMLLLPGFSGELRRMSYDLLFATRPAMHPPEAVLVEIDEGSHKELSQAFNKPWSRALHAQMVERLKEAGARVVVFDVVFSDPGDPAEDAKLAAAIKAHGKVVLGGEVFFKQTQQGANAEQLFPPAEVFEKAAAAWGDVQMPIDPDFTIRRHLPTATEPYALAWEAARLAGARVTQDPREANKIRWINYYCPPGGIPNVPYYQALRPDGTAPGFFKDKIVFIGQRLATGYTGELKDTFGTAFTRLGYGPCAGTEIHANICLNLLREDWLARLPLPLEAGLVIVAGLGLGFIMVASRPKAAIIIALLSGVAVLLAAWLLFRFQHVWFAWLILLGQVLTGLVCALFANSVQSYIEKQSLRKSLDLYLSPVCVEQIMGDPEMLKPGARDAEISILFSDIQDYSRLAIIKKPGDLFNILNQYYETALSSIHKHDGVILQLIGDAIFAIWNAPVPQPNHQERACLAAILLQQHLLRMDLQKHKVRLRTRVGIHTGRANVGNLGSHQRFQYTAVGDTVNLASRLEGLNKHLGTYILATRDIQQHVERQTVSRFVGRFKFKGFDYAVEVYEMLGMGPEVEEATRSWRKVFEDGWERFQEKNFDEAERQFRLAIQLRQEAQNSAKTRAEGTAVVAGSEPGSEEEWQVARSLMPEPVKEDGPSLFYLNKIREFRQSPPADGWLGEIEMLEK